MFWLWFDQSGFVCLWKSRLSFGNCTFAVKERERATLIQHVRVNSKNRLKFLQVFLLWAVLCEKSHVILKSHYTILSNQLCACRLYLPSAAALLVALTCLGLSNSLLLVKKPSLPNQRSWKNKSYDHPGILTEICWVMNTCWLIQTREWKLKNHDEGMLMRLESIWYEK